MSRKILEEEFSKRSVFLDASKLLPDYVPPTLVHREKEFRWLAQVFRPLVQNRASQKALITGNIGVGKTVVSLKFGEELKTLARERGVSLDFIYINCRTEKRLHPICAKLAQHYNPRWPYTSLAPEKLLDMVFAYLKTHELHLLLVLDEADYFVQLNGPDLLYLLTRAAEKSGEKSRVSLITTSRDQSFLYRLDPPTRSTFLHNVLNLSNYTPEQLEDIMNKRIPEAFRPAAVDPETVALIAEIAGRSGNARFALELLWKAGLIADRDNSDVVLPEHAREAKADVYPEIKREVLDELQLHEKLLLLGLARRMKVKKQAYVLTGEAEESYRAVCEEYGEKSFSHTKIWEKLKRLEGLGLVGLRLSGPGQRGRTTKISIPDVPVAWLEKELVKRLEGK